MSTRPFLSIFALLVMAKCAFGDHCEDILKQGIFNVVQVHSDTKAAEEFTHWLKNTSKEEFSKAQNFGLNVVIPKINVPVGTKWESKTEGEFNSFREELLEHKWTNEQVLYMFSKTVDPKLVEAWLKCQELRHKQKDKYGAEATVYGDEILVDLYCNTPSLTLTIKELPEPNQVKLLEPVSKDKGIQIPPSGIARVKYRWVDKSNPAVFVFRTDTEGIELLTVVLPPPAPPQEPRSLRITFGNVAVKRFQTHYLEQIVNKSEFSLKTEVAKFNAKLKISAVDAQNKEVAAIDTGANAVVCEINLRGTNNSHDFKMSRNLVLPPEAKSLKVILDGGAAQADWPNVELMTIPIADIEVGPQNGRKNVSFLLRQGDRFWAEAEGDATISFDAWSK